MRASTTSSCSRTACSRATAKDDFARVGNTWPETAFGSKGEGIGVRKGEKDLLDAINKAILDMRADGTYKQINDKYFDFDIYGG